MKCLCGYECPVCALFNPCYLFCTMQAEKEPQHHAKDQPQKSEISGQAQSIQEGKTVATPSTEARTEENIKEKSERKESFVHTQPTRKTMVMVSDQTTDVQPHESIPGPRKPSVKLKNDEIKAEAKSIGSKILESRSQQQATKLTGKVVLDSGKQFSFACLRNSIVLGQFNPSSHSWEEDWRSSPIAY